jgi:E3 ubiquitin-protein ligase HECTD1
MNDSEALEFCIESLSKLLRIYSSDTFIIDNLLRCIASLTDRFIRKSIEPTQLAKYDLTNILISMLNDNIHQQQQLSQQYTQQQQQQDSSNFSSTANNTNTTSISTIISLLSTLCRNSMQITNEIFKLSILDLIEKAIFHGDERCVLDTMRFLDVLLILIFEGIQNF